MPGKFVVKKGTTGKFRFSLVSTNGQIVATSEAYETKRAALNGIASVKRLAGDAVIEDTTAAKPAAAKPAAKKPAAAKPAVKKPAKARAKR